MNADERRESKAVQYSLPITHNVDEPASGRHRFIGVHRRTPQGGIEKNLSAAQFPFLG
jgi:hypothetical protein